MLFISLGMTMKKAGRDGLFDTWMYQASDLIQNAARSYGERLCSEQFLAAIEKGDESLKPVLTKLRHLYLLDLVEKNLGFFLASKILPLEVGQQVNGAAAALCKELAPQALPLCDAFAIPDSMLSAPIALNWIAYNEYDNQGEV